MTSRKKTSYDEPLLSTNTEFELISESLKRNKQTIPDLAPDVGTNEELGYNPLKASSPHHRQGKSSHRSPDFSRYTIADETETEPSSSNINHPFPHRTSRRDRSSTSQMFSEYRPEHSPFAMEQPLIQNEALILRQQSHQQQQQPLPSQPQRQQNQIITPQNTAIVESNDHNMPRTKTLSTPNQGRLPSNPHGGTVSFTARGGSIYTDTGPMDEENDNLGYGTLEERIQKCGWGIWVFLCICCPIFCPFVLIWYLITTCIRPRCYLMFTMCVSITWIWIDEITDIIFLYFLHQNLIGISEEGHDMILIEHIFIGCVGFNHLLNLLLSVIIRSNWCDDKGVIKQYQYLHHKTIPKTFKFFSLFFIGTLNAATFNTICKTYYLLKNKNNVGTIYIEQRFPCSTTPSSNHTNANHADNRRSTTKSNQSQNQLSKNEVLQKWYNKLYDMEALSIKEMFNTMLEKEAQIYPLLILCQFFESIPKLVIFGLMTGWTEKPHHIYIVCKLIMAVLSFVSEIKSCFISCANAEFIEQFNDE